ncbi:MAG: cobalt ECF transporter T component CbiQ [Acidobacteriota bacterium]|nr:cobalt ECF transporter T component CbiQ [Acidobacteriota bacterium]
MKKSFVERTLSTLLSASLYASTAEDTAASRGALQAIDPRIKVAGLFGLIMAVAASHRLWIIEGVFVIAVVLASASRIRLVRLLNWFWLPVLIFTGAIALPAIFLTPGSPVAELRGICITAQGLRTAGFLISRAETASTLSALLVLTTPWPWVLKALRTFRCPIVIVAVLGMTYRYIFVILQTAFEMFETRKSRTVGILEPRERRRLAASAVGVLLSKSLQLSGDVYLAMQSRGFRGEIYLLQDFRATRRDWWWLSGFFILIAAALWYGR